MKLDWYIVHHMVYYSEQKLNYVFSALADPTRRKMLARLAKEEMSVAELAKPFHVTKSAITKHVKVLETAGLLRRTVQGRVHRCRLEPKPLVAVSDWVKFYEKFWNKKLDALEAYLNESDGDE